MNRAHVAEEDLVTKTAELNRKHAANTKELLDQHARQAVCIEAAENEAKLLKDDVHMLQVRDKRNNTVLIHMFGISPSFSKASTTL
jgi:hypothetical protein